MNGALQLDIEVVYNLRRESRESMYDLRDVVVYLAQRVGVLHGRDWFGVGMAVNAALTANQRRNFLRFFNRYDAGSSSSTSQRCWVSYPPHGLCCHAKR